MPHVIPDMNSESPTKVEKKIEWIKNHPILAWLIFIGIVIIYLATLTDSIDRLAKFSTGIFGKQQEGEHADSPAAVSSEQPPAPPIPSSPPAQTTGPATTTGPNSPAVTGNGNSITYGDKSKRKDDP